MSGYLRVADVAETLDVSNRTVLRWIDADRIEAVRSPGGWLRIAEAELARFIAGCSTSTAAAAGSVAPSTRGGDRHADVLGRELVDVKEDT